MKPEHELELSFFEELSFLDDKGKVFLVKDMRDDTIHVKKILSKDVSDVYDALSKAEIPGIAKVEAVFPDDEQVIVIEEHINGTALSRIMKKRTLKPEEAASVIYFLCDALSILHAMNPPVIHRDIKPSNIIIGKDGTIRLIDFDAASRFTPEKNRDTTLMGTQGYAAPEQYGFCRSGPETDIYAMGVLLNEMLTGRLPVEKMIDGPFASVVEKATAMDPGNRYHSADEMSRAVSLVMHPEREENPSGETSSAERFYYEKKPRRSKYLLPGLDAKEIYVRVMAAAGYALLGWNLLGVDYTDHETGQALYSSRLWVNRICMFFSVFLTVVYLGNFRGVKEKFPPRGSGRHDGLKTTIGAFIMLLIPAAVCVAIERIFYV